MRRERRRRAGERGNALIEFALSFSLLFLIFSGVYEYGYFCWAYDRLESAVRDGAALAARLDYDAYGDGNAHAAAVKNMVVYGSPTGGSTPLVPGLTTSHVNVQIGTDSMGIPTAVTVRLANFPVNSVFRTYTISKPAITSRFYGGYKTHP